MKRLQQFCTIAFLCCCLPFMANAQSASSAQISGTVVDPQGAVVPGAKVTATNQATGTGRSVTTTSTGNYVIPNLQPGTYDVAVDAKGFAPGSTKNIVLNLGDQRDLGFKLGCGRIHGKRGSDDDRAAHRIHQERMSPLHHES